MSPPETVPSKQPFTCDSLERHFTILYTELRLSGLISTIDWLPVSRFQILLDVRMQSRSWSGKLEDSHSLNSPITGRFSCFRLALKSHADYFHPLQMESMHVIVVIRVNRGYGSVNLWLVKVSTLLRPWKVKTSKTVKLINLEMP
jgi:hypothetical protein